VEFKDVYKHHHDAVKNIEFARICGKPFISNYELEMWVILGIPSLDILFRDRLSIDQSELRLDLKSASFLDFGV